MDVSELATPQPNDRHLTRRRTGPMAATDVAAAVSTLPIPTTNPTDRYSPPRLTYDWLQEFGSDHTRAAYYRDLSTWLAFCAATHINPLSARRADIDAYTRVLKTSDTPPAPSTLARRLSALSSWYRYLVSNEAAERNPMDAVKRPTFNRDQSSTVGLTVTQVKSFLRTARADTSHNKLRNRALLGLLAELGTRVSELTSATLADLRHNTGYRTIIIHGKGGKDRELPIPPTAGADLDTYLAQRATAANVAVADLSGPIFVTRNGKPLTQPQVFTLIRRIAAAADIPSATDLSPHSFRHAAATAALNDGAPLRDVQDFLGHADPRTTRRYDRNRGALSRSPVHRLAALYSIEGEDQ